MKDKEYAEAKKPYKNSPFYPLENKFRRYVVPKIPNFLETYHFTFSTILWSAFVIVFGYLASKNILWLLAFSFAILMQWVTDLLDGEVGRYRNTGLVKWGFFADHFLDYLFLASLLLGYHFLFLGEPAYNPMLLLGISFLSVGFLVISYLHFAATKNFAIAVSKIYGPSEMRFSLIIFNFALIFFGASYFMKFMLPFLIIEAVFLIVIFYFVQRKIWRLDMKIKRKNLKDLN